MSLWIGLAVIAQLFYAVVAIIDKYIITSERVTRPIVLTFYVSILSSLTILVFLIGTFTSSIFGFNLPALQNISMPTSGIVWLSIFSAITFILALFSLFSAFKKADTSDVVPVSGSMSAVTALILSYLFLDGELTTNFVIGIVILVLGMLLVSLFRFSIKTLIFSISAGVLFGSHFVLIKLIFNQTNFDNGFFWTRLVIVLVSFLLLFIPKCKEHVKVHKGKTSRKNVWAWILGNKVLAGIAAILALKATELGDVSVVQALGALQFAFLLIISIFFGSKIPYSCGENCNKQQRKQKALSVIVISIGFFILFI